jgi:hypothetical protein
MGATGATAPPSGRTVPGCRPRRASGFAAAGLARRIHRLADPKGRWGHLPEGDRGPATAESQRFRVGRDSSTETALAEILQHHEVRADLGGLVGKQGHSVR